MQLPHRRQFLRLAAGAAALPAVPRFAWAQTYPTRPIRWVVPFPAGGSTDIVARVVGQVLSERLGQPVVIENRSGAGGNAGTQVVVNSPADGYTLLFVPTGAAISATLYSSLPYNFIRDIAPVSGLADSPNVMAVNPSVPAKSVAEFISYAKANPGKLNMASSGIGTAVHMAGELFKLMAGVDLTHVPYRGGSAAMTDLIGGQVHVQFDVMPNSIPHIQSGATRALAVTTATRADALPNVPTISETVAGYEMSTWFGVGVPRGTPAEIIEKLNREINAVLAEPRIRARFAELGSKPLLFSPAEFGAHVAAETAKWAKVIRAANIKAE